MTVLSDIMLPQLEVLDSAIAYREAGDLPSPGRAFSTRQSDFLLHLAKHSSARCAGGALHRAGSHRLRPIRKTQTSSIALRIMCDTSMHSSTALESLRHSSLRRIGVLRWHFI